MTEKYRFTASAEAPARPETRQVLMWPEKRPIPAWEADEPYRTECVQRRKAEGHAERMKTASALLDVMLDPQRCRFGPKRVTLTGTFNAETPQQATVTVFDLLQWTLAQVYGAERDYLRRVALTGVRVDLRATPMPD